MTDALGPEIDRTLRDLLSRWQYLRYVPSQGLEAVRSAAQVVLTDESAPAAAVTVEELSCPQVADAAPTVERAIHEAFLRMVLAGEFEAKRRAPGAESRRPIKEFVFRIPPGTEVR